jgi:hypothetical protein
MGAGVAGPATTRKLGIKKPMRWGCLIGLVLAVAIGTAGWHFLSRVSLQDPPNSELPPLVRGTPANHFGTNAADPVFRRRVTAMFPVGSSAGKMVQELKRQGFELHTKNGETTASFTQWGITRRDWWITWTVDGEGRICAIGAFENWTSL